MEIVSLTPETEELYEKFLTSQSDALLYYSLSFKNFLENLLGCKANYRIALEDGEIVGVLPLMVKSGPWGEVINSLPYYGSNGSIFAANDKAYSALCQEFDNVASQANVAAAMVVTHPFRQSEASPVQCNFEDDRIGQLTELPDKNVMDVEAEILSMIDGSTRRNIRKAQKSGVDVLVDCDAWDFLQTVHVDNMAMIGGLAKTNEFFSLAKACFNANEDYRIYVATREGKMVSALLLFYSGCAVEYFTPVTVSEERSYQPLAAIILRAMVDAVELGYKWWNWGGTWKAQEGVYKFKKKWNASDFPYRYYIQLNNKEVLERTAEEVLESYPGFYLVPFSELKRVP